MSVWSLNCQQSVFKSYHIANIYESFTHKMAAKISWHRYESKLRQCHRVYCANDERYQRVSGMSISRDSRLVVVYWTTLFIGSERHKNKNKTIYIQHQNTTESALYYQAVASCNVRIPLDFVAGRVWPYRRRSWWVRVVNLALSAVSAVRH